MNAYVVRKYACGCCFGSMKDVPEKEIVYIGTNAILDAFKHTHNHYGNRDFSFNIVNVAARCDACGPREYTEGCGCDLCLEYLSRKSIADLLHRSIETINGMIESATQYSDQYNKQTMMQEYESARDAINIEFRNVWETVRDDPDKSDKLNKASNKVADRLKQAFKIISDMKDE